MFSRLNDGDDLRAPELWTDTGLEPGIFFLAATLHEQAFPVDSYSAQDLQKSFKNSSFEELFLR